MGGNNDLRLCARPDMGEYSIRFARYSVVAAIVAGNLEPGPEEG